MGVRYVFNMGIIFTIRDVDAYAITLPPLKEDNPENYLS
jgi:hypothetical protein